MAREGTEDQVMEKSVIIGREIYESSQVYSQVLTFKLLQLLFPWNSVLCLFVLCSASAAGHVVSCDENARKRRTQNYRDGFIHTMSVDSRWGILYA